MKPLSLIAFVIVSTVLSLPLFIIFFISPAVTNLVEENAKEESLRVASHLASMLISEEAELEKGVLPLNFPAEAEKIRKDFDLMKLRVFSASGEVIYSTKSEEIGAVTAGEYFRNSVTKGSVYSAVARKGSKTIEGKISEIDAAETYVPLMREGKFSGAFEVYYDITERFSKLNAVLKRSYFLLFAAVLGLMSAAIAALYRAGNSLAERDIARKEWERTFDAVTDPIMILDPQFRMMRVNKAMSELLGVAPEQAIGKACYEHVHLTSWPIPDCPNKKLLEDGSVHTAEIYEERVGRHYSVTVFPMFDSEGSLTATVHYAKDISKRKKAEEDLRATETKYRIIADNTYAWEFWLDPDFRYIYSSPSCKRVTGYLPNEFVSDPGLFLSIVHPDDRQQVVEHQSLMLEKAMSGKIMFRIVRRDGAVRWIDHICQPIYDSGGKFLGLRGSNSDISERRQMYETLQRQLKNMTALSDIGIAISSSLNLKVTLNMLLERLISQLGIDAATVLLLDEETLYLNCAASLGFRTSSSLRKTSVRMGKGNAGRAAYERRLLIIPDLGNTLTQAFKEEEFKAYIAVPLMAQGKVKGVLEIFQRSRFDPSTEWLSFVEPMSTQAAIAIDNAAMFDSLQRTNLELTLSYDATIEGWGRTLEFRDEDTMGHTNRVTEMAVRFARMMSMEEKDILHLRRGAMLHDIGKISIPDSVLLKAGPLTDKERDIMNRHPRYAYELLFPIPFLRPALDIPYCHHEKWDGTGYPRGLKGEDIPFAARIFAVVDVCDALLSNRPYRPAWPLEKVREYVLSLSGIDFDPSVVETFLKILDEQGGILFE